MPPVAEAKAMPSSPTWISTMSVTPLAWHSAYSLTFIRRLALAISGVLAPTPAQNSLMPPPVEPVLGTTQLRNSMNMGTNSGQRE